MRVRLLIFWGLTMDDRDKKRFLAVLDWLCEKYPIDGKPRVLPEIKDFVPDYFAALRDLPIEDVEQGARWYYSRCEFFPDRPASLRRSCQEWRKENPHPYQPPEPVRRVLAVQETPESREEGARALSRVLEALSRGEKPQIYTVSDFTGSV